MTEPQDDIPASTLDALEPAARTANSHTPDRAALSQAISLRRIADALEQLAAPITGTVPAFVPPTDEQRAAVELYLADTPGQFVPYGASGHDFPWQDWPGGECPVAAGTPVDVRFRDGEELHGTEAQRVVPGRPRDAAYVFWDNQDLRNDIVAWRLAR